MKYFNLLILMLTSFSFAQDSRLFENQWFLTNIIVNGNDNIPPFNNMRIFFFQQNSGIEINDGCNSLIGASTFPPNNSSDFSFTSFGQTFLECADRIEYEQLYFGFFNENTTFTNDFTYSISELGNENTLVINSLQNNQAIYSTQMLSVDKYQKLDFIITPNPITDYINIKLDKPTTENIRFEIYDSLGKLCTTGMLNENQVTINVENLAKGVYLVTVKNQTETFTKKFVKL